MATPNNIAVPNEVDAWIVTLQPNTSYLAIVSGASTSGGSSTLRDPFVGVGSLTTGEVIQVQDNPPAGGMDPQMPFQVPAAGDYVVAVGDITGGTGTYQVGVFDQQANPQPTNFVTEIVVDPAMTSSTPGGIGPTPGSIGPGTSPGGLGTSPGGLGTSPGGLGTSPGGLGTSPGGLGTSPGGLGTSPGGLFGTSPGGFMQPGSSQQPGGLTQPVSSQQLGVTGLPPSDTDSGGIFGA